ncbi:Golgi apparatus membrane protein tvp23 [Coemansia sp. RSA 2523]|nr:Golgi apparatus membrane protein tvp23 [Coemansia sp. RSA 1591]KAJ1753926.1 Golgi apparatus membrane protein tvp23 [Coemansia sp. RSA 1752]KAJ1781396.1 Golgi apparatus membrane protein tvp23 [Coemansia sp. RSA 1938]KAJ1798009.1 Golgi apparatus membrane protein tvp23 [Coemansia sp. RSA 2523]KAJ2118866.1 Golgi apparatus membrane protein tvp23 [Coemansia sp. RSA 921]KAJ2140883.1 Golgi apparatus membrane protein tvp23 [Coemansia sp. RSA 678]KAJ2151780.1 Golgi apparatus membrane protein tvp23 [
MSYQQPDTAVSPTEPTNMFKVSSHPLALLCLILFKACALGLYLLGNFFTNNFILIFVLCVLILAIDFWMIKNISGRLLVGLRWWNEVLEDGSNEWIFESRDVNVPVNASDSRIFWTVLYGTPAVWSLLAIVAFFSLRFQWLLIVIIAVVLAAANLIGYQRCDKDQKRRWNQISQGGDSSFVSGMVSGLMSNAVSSGIMGRFFSRG